MDHEGEDAEPDHEGGVDVEPHRPEVKLQHTVMICKIEHEISWKQNFIKKHVYALDFRRFRERFSARLASIVTKTPKRTLPNKYCVRSSMLKYRYCTVWSSVSDPDIDPDPGLR
jgi:hypothetical protein